VILNAASKHTDQHAKMPKTPLSKKEFETLSHFRYLLRRFLRFSEEVSRQHGITHLQYQMMLQRARLSRTGVGHRRRLAERLQSHHHGVVSLVTRCEKLGLVQRREGRSDRREVEIHLTPKGNELVALLAGLHRDELIRMQGIFRIPGSDDLGVGEDAGR